MSSKMKLGGWKAKVVCCNKDMRTFLNSLRNPYEFGIKGSLGQKPQVQTQIPRTTKKHATEQDVVSLLICD